ncbi:MAG: alpha/beta hydrolase, partial [Chloroflexota bacterium]|nr:alpha/beta hydrolase [Chloroflexota bacterium]
RATQDPGMIESGRARLPDTSTWVRGSDGVAIAYDVYGSDDPTIVFLPSTPIVHSRQWKAQVPYLSRHYRVVTYDGRGNGRSDRPADPSAYREERLVGDLEAVMDASGTRSAVLVGLCGDGVWRAIEFAAANPSRVLGIVAFAVGVPLLSPPHPWRIAHSFEDDLASYEGWARVNRHSWRRDYPGFAQFFFSEITSEPHSTKLIEDAIGWAVDGSVDAMIADAEVDSEWTLEGVEAICRQVACPMLLVHGTADTCQPIARARRLSELTGAPLVVVEGADHMIPGRHPVKANLLIRDFVESISGGPA